MKLVRPLGTLPNPPEDFILSGILAYCQVILPLRMVLLILRIYKRIIKLCKYPCLLKKQ